jgi:hypothetical protein
MTRLKRHAKRLRAVQERKDLRPSKPSSLVYRRLEQIKRRSKVKKREDRVGS